MAETAEKNKVPEQYEYKWKNDYKSDWDIHRDYINTFDPYEAMLVGQVYDEVSNSIDGSKITDSYSATLVIERAARVMGKLPDGNTESSAKADQGKAVFMDILRQKWIYPNANSQHSFETKLRLWQMYSSVYGYMPMYYDWNVATSGYVGPDCWLWSPRNLVPQQGRTSIADMEYVTALTWVSKSWLQDKSDNITEDDGWDQEALDMLIEVAENAKTSPDNDKDTKIARDRSPQATRRGICLATRYEAGEDGRWITFAPDYGYCQVRSIKNPHKNGRIPFVIKYSQPLFDSFYGLGDFQRAKPLQFARDGLTNFYFKGIKMNLIPPIVANANGVMKHTLDYREGSVMLETIPNSIRRLETSNAGLATYQGAQTALTGSLLSLFGSQNASIPGSDALNPSQGKTPQAISLYEDKEATRDGQERNYLEEGIESLTDGFFSLVANIGTEDIPVNMYAEDIEEIVKSGYKDVLGLLKGKFTPNSTLTGGELKIDPAALKGVEYRFNINENSTSKQNKQALVASLDAMLQRISGFQNLFQEDGRVDINWKKIMEAYSGLTDLPGSEDFITYSEGPSPQEQEQQKQQAAQTAEAQTQVKSPNGQVSESADLVKLYLGTDDQNLKDQIITALGFQPGPAAPTTIGSGHTFHDPSIAAAASALHEGTATAPGGASPQAAPEEDAEPELNVTSKGTAFHDPSISKVAEAIHNME